MTVLDAIVAAQKALSLKIHDDIIKLGLMEAGFKLDRIETIIRWAKLKGKQ